MEIYNRNENEYIEVWLTNQEQEEIDRAEFTKQILSDISSKKYKVVFFLSGQKDLYRCTENLLTGNI